MKDNFHLWVLQKVAELANVSEAVKHARVITNIPRRLRPQLAMLLLLAAGLSSSAFASAFPTRCQQEFEPVGNSLRYSLFVTVPTTGYHFSLVRTRVKSNVVNIRLRGHLDPGLHAQVVQMHRVRFVLDGPHFPDFYVATVDGHRQGRAKVIAVPVL